MPRRPLNETEKHDWLRLSRTKNVGPITFRQLLRRFGSARAALDALPAMAQHGGRKSFILPPKNLIDDEFANIEKMGAQLIAWCEPDYPESLAAIEDAPPLITVRGNVGLMHKRCIGIVGARNASLNGRKMAESLAQELGQKDFAIVSGMARGIDTAGIG